MLGVPPSPPATPLDVEALAQRAHRLAERARADRRAVLGLVGPPGAGKSTLGEALVAAARAAGVRTELVPMDGFHLAQRQLVRLGLTDVKGAPETFDAVGFVALLRRLRDREPTPTFAPQFERALEEPVGGAIAVEPDVDLVVTEGNYLLLDVEPWSAVRGLLDEAWFLRLHHDVRRRRLQARHEQYGRTADEALERTLGSDEANAVLVERTAGRADLVVDLTGGGVRPGR